MLRTELVGPPTGYPADIAPAPPVLQAHIEAVHADWKEYLNLLICEESHLKFMEDFHKVPEPWGHKAQPRESPEHEQAPAARETG